MHKTGLAFALVITLIAATPTFVEAERYWVEKPSARGFLVAWFLAIIAAAYYARRTL